MEEMNVQKKKSTLKGAVLFTVLCVMAVMLVLVMATITLAGVASKRAYSEYQDAQVVATAKSVVDSVVTSLAPGGENSDLGRTIYQQVGANRTTPYTIYIKDGGNLGNGLGTVEKIDFSYAGIDELDDFYIKGSDYMIMKVTATVRMGSETTTYTEYLSDMVYSAGSGGDGGLLSTSGVNADSTGITVIGPFGGGLNQVAATGETVILKNEGVHIDTVSFNTSISLNVKKLFLFDKNTPVASYDTSSIGMSNYQGISVLGNLNFSSDGVSFMARQNSAVDKERPYIFVTGEINYGSCSVSIGSYKEDTPNKDNLTSDMIGNKFNVYCGNFVCGNELKDVNAAADIYCYNETKTSVFGGQNGTHLLDWIAQQQAGAAVNGNTITGNIYSKGNVLLKATGLCIDGDLYVEGELDLSQLTGSEIPEVTGNIYAGSVKEPTPPNADPKYAALRSKVQAIGANTFPPEKELEKILGIEFTGAPSTDSEKLAAIDSGAYVIEPASGVAIDLSNKIVQNPLEMNTRFYVTDPSDPTKKVLKGSKNASGVTTTTEIVGTSATTTTEIVEDCTLTGTFQNWTININPGNDITKPLWINLDNVTFDGGCRIIVEDRAKDAAGNFIMDPTTGEYQKAAPVCFYITDNTKLTLGGVKIVTKYYNDTYFNNTSQLQTDLTLTSSPAPEYIPGIYIYGCNDESFIGTEQIIIQNNTLITGYIIAPRAVLKVTDVGEVSTKTLNYNGVDYDKLKIGVIGSVIVGPIGHAPGETATGEVANDLTVIYVSNNTSTAAPPMETFAYKQIPGYATY